MNSKAAKKTKPIVKKASQQVEEEKKTPLVPDLSAQKQPATHQDSTDIPKKEEPLGKIAISAKASKKDKKKQKKKQSKTALDIKRKLSVDPAEGKVAFLNFNANREEKLEKEKRKREKSKSAKKEKPHESEDEDGDDSSDANDNEEFEDYKENGYHAIHLGEILNNKYVIVKKLGWGHFSTVWLAFNVQDKKLYALKILRSHKKYLTSAYDEEAICKIIADNYASPVWVKSIRQYLNQPTLQVSRQHTHCLQMYDWFNHHGQNGRHFTMAFEVLGKNLLTLVKKYDYRGIPIPIVREITRQLLIGLDYMHRVCKLIHTDLKPENITFSLKEEEQFDLLYKYVFCTPLVDLFESKEKIILNKKQQKNQKKKDRKKKKKLQDKKVGGVAAQDEQEEEETKEDVSDKEEESKALSMIETMRKKLEEAGKEHFVIKKRRTVSEDRVVYQQEMILSYREKAAIQEHPRVQKKQREFLRVASQSHLWSDVKKFNDIKPMEEIDVRALKEQKVEVKIVDMGNACYVDEHFSDIIQTRQYRSPEVIVRADYDTSADMWSLACTVFELVTGDFLFEPRKGRNYTKNEDHLALITELIGECKNPKLLLKGYKAEKFYDKNGKLKNIKKLKMWDAYHVLLEKYRLRDFEARGLADFLEKILKWDPKDRPSAQEMLDHYWLKMIPNYSTKMTKQELREYKRVHKFGSVSASSKSSNNADQISDVSKDREECNNVKAQGDIEQQQVIEEEIKT